MCYVIVPGEFRFENYLWDRDGTLFYIYLGLRFYELLILGFRFLRPPG